MSEAIHVTEFELFYMLCAINICTQLGVCALSPRVPRNNMQWDAPVCPCPEQYQSPYIPGVNSISGHIMVYK
jgi:hypothetical protein